jgi:hypothetical protein
MSAQHLSGSCICGAVAYEINGDVQTFLHCHCSRCRKASGTGHASNLIVKLESIAWTSGEELLQRYDVPGAKRFHTVFCSICGSPMPRVAADRSVSVIPAGTLDKEPEAKVAGRIFQDSRAGWSCQGDELPAWDQYPAAPG